MYVEDGRWRFPLSVLHCPATQYERRFEKNTCLGGFTYLRESTLVFALHFWLPVYDGDYNCGWELVDEQTGAYKFIRAKSENLLVQSGFTCLRGSMLIHFW